jgi:hypothetical protein
VPLIVVLFLAMIYMLDFRKEAQRTDSDDFPGFFGQSNAESGLFLSNPPMSGENSQIDDYHSQCACPLLMLNGCK